MIFENAGGGCGDPSCDYQVQCSACMTAGGRQYDKWCTRHGRRRGGGFSGAMDRMFEADHAEALETNHGLAAPTQAEQDRALGYNYALDSGEYSLQWLVSEVRMLHVQRDREVRERLESERRMARREANQRHVIAHEIAARMFAWKLGKHATAGALRALDAVYPTRNCPDDCTGGVA